MRRDLQNLRTNSSAVFSGLWLLSRIWIQQLPSSNAGGQRNKGGGDRSVFHPHIAGPDRHRPQPPGVLLSRRRPVFFGFRQFIDKILVITTISSTGSAPRRGRPGRSTSNAIFSGSTGCFLYFLILLRLRMIVKNSMTLTPFCLVPVFRLSPPDSTSYLYPIPYISNISYLYFIFLSATRDILHSLLFIPRLSNII